MEQVRQLTKEQAIVFAENMLYLGMDYKQRAIFQMQQERLCMPFDVFHEAVEKALGRPVYTHEFGFNRDGILKELLGEKDAPTFDEIMELIPAEKRVMIFL